MRDRPERACYTESRHVISGKSVLRSAAIGSNFNFNLSLSIAMSELELNVYCPYFWSTQIEVSSNASSSDIRKAVSNTGITNIRTIYLVRPLVSALPRHTRSPSTCTSSKQARSACQTKTLCYVNSSNSISPISPSSNLLENGIAGSRRSTRTIFILS